LSAEANSPSAFQLPLSRTEATSASVPVCTLVLLESTAASFELTGFLLALEKFLTELKNRFTLPRPPPGISHDAAAADLVTRCCRRLDKEATEVPAQDQTVGNGATKNRSAQKRSMMFVDRSAR